MVAKRNNSALVSRRRLFGFPLVLLQQSQVEARASFVTRELVASVERDEGLNPPLTLGIARVVLRPGATVVAEIPSGARMIVVESGVLAVRATPQDARPLTSAELSRDVPVLDEGDELFVPAGATITFGSLGVSHMSNPGARSVVALDVAVFREEPRPISRGFTTENGISFQLLASASAPAGPDGGIALSLERVRLSAKSKLPADLTRGLTLTYIEAGTIELKQEAGNVFAARAAASTPYSMPGSLQPLGAGNARSITAGGVVFLPIEAESSMTNLSARSADLLVLAVREASSEGQR